MGELNASLWSPNAQADKLGFDLAQLDAEAAQLDLVVAAAEVGEPAIVHACMDMSAAFLKGATQYLPNALVSYDRFHIVALVIISSRRNVCCSKRWKGTVDPKQRPNCPSKPSGSTHRHTGTVGWQLVRPFKSANDTPRRSD